MYYDCSCIGNTTISTIRYSPLSEYYNSYDMNISLPNAYGGACSVEG